MMLPVGRYQILERHFLFIEIMETGDKVKFEQPMTEFEQTAIYEIVNINEVTGRALITILNGNLPIAPTELVYLNDLKII